MQCYEYPLLFLCFFVDILLTITHISDNKLFLLIKIFYNNPCFFYFKGKQVQSQPVFFPPKQRFH